MMMMEYMTPLYRKMRTTIFLSSKQQAEENHTGDSRYFYVGAYGGGDDDATVDTATSAEASTNKCCSVCLEEFQKGDIVVRSKFCPHIHCQDCINDWMARQNSCPCCRRKIVRESAYFLKRSGCPDDDDFIDG
jgi:hypothetical protein